MNSEFKKAKLVDLCELISRGITPSYTEDIEEGVVVLNQKCIRDNKINYQLAKLTNPNKKKVTENKYLRKYDILVNSTGVGTLGRVAQVKKLDKKMTVDSHVTIVRPKAEIDPIYLGYYMFMKQKYIEYLGEGSTGQTELSRVRLGDALEVNFPSLEEQKAIAKVLSDLDEKIETNNKINKKLEEMAQAIFKQWFVDFEFPNEDGKPYKSSGGEMVESELGMIPSGWKVELLKSYCDVKKGLSYKGKHLVEDGTPMINLGNVNPGGGFRRDKCKFYDGDFKEQHTVKAGDIIIANTDMTQERVILGSPIFVPDFKTESIIFTHHLFAFRNLKIPKSFLYYYLKSKSFRERAESYATGTTVLAISRDSVLNINFVKANNEVLNNFDLITKSILDRIENNNLEIEKLQKLRDELLPKLMSGEIRINNVNI